MVAPQSSFAAMLVLILAASSLLHPCNGSVSGPVHNHHTFDDDPLWRTGAAQSSAATSGRDHTVNRPAHSHYLVHFRRRVGMSQLQRLCPEVFTGASFAKVGRHTSDANGAPMDAAHTNVIVYGKLGSAIDCLESNGRIGELPHAAVHELPPTSKLHSAYLAHARPELIPATSNEESPSMGTMADRSLSSFETALTSNSTGWLHTLLAVIVVCPAASSGAAPPDIVRDVKRVLVRFEGASKVVLASSVVLPGSRAPFSQDVTQTLEDAASKMSGACADVHISVPFLDPREDAENRPTLRPQTLVALAGLPYVRRLEPRPPFKAMNNIATVTLQSETSTSRPIWEQGLTGTGQIVAIGDTGLDYDSCFFDDVDHKVAVWPQVSHDHRKVVSYIPCTLPDGTREVADVADAHGTHVAGSVAGNAVHNARSSSPEHKVQQRSDFNGLAKDAKIFFNDLTCGTRANDQTMVLPGDLYEAHVPGYSVGARVSSNSWGDYAAPKEYTAVNRRTDAFAYDFRDMLVVFAAGNSPSAGVISPAAAKNVLTIGAHPNSLNANDRESVCSFSARGRTFDGRIKPDVLAPGQSIQSARSDGSLTSHQCELKSLFGTSMACPHAAGSATLLRQYFMEGFYPTGRRNAADAWEPTAATLKAALVHSSHHLRQIDAAPDATEGYGRIELADVFYFSQGPGSSENATRHVEFIESSGLDHHGRADWCVTADSYAASAPVRDVRVTLVWMDPALAAEGASESVVNDLDLLVVRTTDGHTFHGNAGGAAGTSGDLGANFDHENIVEKVVIPGAASGQYTVTVWGFHVELAQNFSLVVSAPGLDVRAGPCTASSSNTDATVCPIAKDESAAVCSGHGTCSKADGRCQCSHGYTHADCHMCDSELVCSGNGVCDVGDLSCACEEATDPRVAPNCSACKPGHFGPHCDFDCSCTHGTCNKMAGACRCDASEATGYWGGLHCDKCAHGYMDGPVASDGTPVNGPTSVACRQPAAWCVHREIVDITVGPGEVKYFVISSDAHYANSLTCRWRITQTNPLVGASVQFPHFDVERGYDMVSVYTVNKTKLLGDPGELLAHGTATSPPRGIMTSLAGGSVLVQFESDFANEGEYTGIIGMAWASACNSAVCGSHGSCNYTLGHCVCDDNFDESTNCSSCIAGFGGEYCNQSATESPSTSTSQPTSLPTDTATAVATSTPTPPAHTDAPPSAACIVPGNNGLGPPCSGHGTCADGRCTCNLPYGSTYCEQQCPHAQSGAGTSSTVCNGHGSCRQDNATCRCDATHVGIACQVPVKHLTVLRPSHSVARLPPLDASVPQQFLQYVPETPLPLPYPSSQALGVEIRVSWRERSVKSASRRFSSSGATSDDGETEPPATLPTTTAQVAATISVWNDRLHAGDDDRAVMQFDAVGESCLTVLGWNNDRAQSSTIGLRLTHGVDPTRVVAPLVSVTEFIDTNASNVLPGTTSKLRCRPGRVCSVVSRCIVTGASQPLKRFILVGHSDTDSERTDSPGPHSSPSSPEGSAMGDNATAILIVLLSFGGGVVVVAVVRIVRHMRKVVKYDTLDDEAGAGGGDTQRPTTRAQRIQQLGRASASSPHLYGDSVIEMRPRDSLPTPAGATGGSADPARALAETPQRPTATDASPPVDEAARGNDAVDDDDDDDEDLIGDAHAAALSLSPGGFAPGSQVPDFSV